MQNIAARGIADFDGGVRGHQLASIARVAEVVEDGFAEHRQEYRNGRRESANGLGQTEPGGEPPSLGHRYHGRQFAVAEVGANWNAGTDPSRPKLGCLLLLIFRGEKFLFDRGDNDVVGVDHFGEMEFADLGEQFVGVELG